MTYLSRALFAVAVLALPAASARAAEVDPLLPAETESIFFVNVRQALDSDIVKKNFLGQLKQVLKGDDAQKTLNELGLNPLTDIDRLIVGSWGKDKDDMQGVAVLRGKFDPEKLFKAATAAAAKESEKISVVEAGDYKLIKFTNDGKTFFAAVANEKTIVAGSDKKLVVAAMEASQKGTKPAIKKELAALLLKMDEKATMFACGLTEGKVGELPPINIPGVDGDALAKQLGNVQNVSMTFRITEDVSLDISMGMKDGDSADELGKAVDQLINTAKTFLPLVAGQQPKLKPLADELGKNLKSKVKDKDVVLMLKLSADAISKAAAGEDD
jgi:hypothetical protein